MPLIALGLNHQTAPLALREKVALTPRRCRSALAALRAAPGVEEAALLSTCNRTEIYAAGRARAAKRARRAGWRAPRPGCRGADELSVPARRRRGGAPLFRVATGLDSMVLGEPQILGQVKEAWQAARDAAQSAATRSTACSSRRFAVAKRVRTDTRIGAHPVSVAFAAVRLARQVFARLDQATRAADRRRRHHRTGRHAISPTPA